MYPVIGGNLYGTQSPGLPARPVRQPVALRQSHTPRFGMNETLLYFSLAFGGAIFSGLAAGGIGIVSCLKKSRFVQNWRAQSRSKKQLQTHVRPLIKALKSGHVALTGKPETWQQANLSARRYALHLNGTDCTYTVMGALDGQAGGGFFEGKDKAQIQRHRLDSGDGNFIEYQVETYPSLKGGLHQVRRFKAKVAHQTYEDKEKAPVEVRRMFEALLCYDAQWADEAEISQDMMHSASLFGQFSTIDNAFSDIRNQANALEKTLKAEPPTEAEPPAEKTNTKHKRRKKSKRKHASAEGG